jgi:hypothetical protein
MSEPGRDHTPQAERSASPGIVSNTGSHAAGVAPTSASARMPAARGSGGSGRSGTRTPIPPGQWQRTRSRLCDGRRRIDLIETREL